MIEPTHTIRFLPRTDGVRQDIQTGRPPASEESPRIDGQDSIQISQEGREKAANDLSHSPAISTDPNTELSADDQRRVDELKQRDQDVKAHEQAHMAAGGGIVQGGASYEYEKGPDGNMYAVGGEVKIDSSPENDPAATIRKMAQVRRAALAPMDPSSTDRSVAAKAYQMENQARVELARQQQEGGSADSQPTANEPSSNAPADPEFDPANPQSFPSTTTSINTVA